MNWTLLDYVAASILLAGLAGGIWLVFRASTSSRYRLASAIALLAAFLLVWVNAAVGIIGGENNNANLMFAGVLAVGVAGALIARFRARGMSLALFATAIAQASVGGIAVLAGLGSNAAAWPRDILLLSGFFVVLWLVSAALFRTAARQQDQLPA